MININLLGESKDNTAMNILQMIIFCSVLFVSLLVCFFVSSSMSKQLDEAKNEQTVFESKLTKLKKETKKVDELEKKKVFLANKLTTIASLKAGRQGPVQLLDNITIAIPERAWLTNLSRSGEDIEFQGLAVDNQTVSGFMADLKQSVFFSSVDLSYSKLFMRDGVKLQNFNVVAKLENPIALQKKLNEASEARDVALAEDGEVAPAEGSAIESEEKK